MSLFAMPWIVVNMGCEMVFILAQRLRAQEVPASRACRVLCDIVGTLLDRHFVAEKLFVPQEMYSLSSTRKIFDRLAHSSIMRLNESSMDKLFDLMLMSAKYQLVCSSCLDDLMQATLRHLAAVKEIVLAHATAADSNQAAVNTALELLENAELTTVTHYSCLGVGQLALLRQTVARFFQDRRVKASLLLAEGIQAPNGRLILQSCIKDSVGMVRTFGPGGRVETEERLPLAALQTNAGEFFCHPVPLGDNLYAAARSQVVPPPRTADGVAAPAPPGAGEDGAPAAGNATQQDAGSGAAKQELRLLAALVHTKAAAADNFSLDLFGTGDDDPGLLRCGQARVSNQALEEEAEQEGHASGARRGAQVIECGAVAGRTEGYKHCIQGMLGDLGLNDAAGEEGADLLALMDSVS